MTETATRECCTQASSRGLGQSPPSDQMVCLAAIIPGAGLERAGALP